MYSAQCTVHILQCTFHNVHFTVYISQCTFHSVHFTMYISQWTFHSVQGTVKSAQCTVHSAPCCTVYSVQCTVYTLLGLQRQSINFLVGRRCGEETSKSKLQISMLLPYSLYFRLQPALPMAPKKNNMLSSPTGCCAVQFSTVQYSTGVEWMFTMNKTGH